MQKDLFPTDVCRIAEHIVFTKELGWGIGRSLGSGKTGVHRRSPPHERVISTSMFSLPELRTLCAKRLVLVKGMSRVLGAGKSLSRPWIRCRPEVGKKLQVWDPDGANRSEVRRVLSGGSSQWRPYQMGLRWGRDVPHCGASDSGFRGYSSGQ